MVDLAPEGFIHLPDLFERYCLWLWNGHYPREELEVERRLSALPGEWALMHRTNLGEVQEAAFAETVALFVNEDLRAVVRDPRSSEHLAIPARAWRDAFFPERMLLSDEIRAGHGQHFDAAVGRTPFIKVQELDAAFAKAERQKSRLSSRSRLRDALIGLVMDGVMTSREAEQFGSSWGLEAFARKPQPNAFDPNALGAWTFAMAVAWISWRDISAVREVQDDYRENCWEWFGFSRRLPLRGGEEWYEVHGEELRTLRPSSVTMLGLVEALGQPGAERQLLSVKSSREELWRALSSGEIVATGLDPRGAVTEIGPNEWPYLELAADDNLSDFVIQRARGLGPAYSKLTLLRSAISQLWPARPAIRNDRPQVGSELQFDPTEPVWTLWGAAIWIGSDGRQLTSQAVADGNLDDAGAGRLFPLLSDGRVAATGFNRQRIREVIPAVYWELATVNPELFRERHFVSFIDDVLEEFGGQLTPFGEDAPRWFGIRIRRDDLFAAFPDLAPPEGPITGSAAYAAEELTSGGELRSNGPRRSARKLAGARQAISELFPGGIPSGLTDKERLDTVNGWLLKNGHSRVSLSTLNRAAKKN